MKLQSTRVLLAALVLGLVATSTFAVCDFGVNTCLPGFVWRDAFAGDQVCVVGATRSQAANDNQQAPQRRVPGSDTCIPGFVWREASPSDHVCVTGATRTQTAADNASVGTRRDPQCANPAQTDASPPSFVPNATTIAFFRVPDNLQVGSEPIPATGLNKAGVARDRRFVITTAAGDPDSGITRLQLVGEIGWKCTSQLNPDTAVNRQGTLASFTDEQKSNTGAPGSPPVRTGHFSIDPFEGNALRLVCPCMDDSGPLRLSFTIVATNGKGLETRSAPISIAYVSQAPSCGAASGEVCGNKSDGQTKLCLGGQTCDVKRSTACSGWWIFRTCDRIQTTDMFCQ